MLANIFQQGLRADYDEDYYHSLPFFSNSGMKEFSRSPAHFHQWLKTERKSTPAKKIGSVLHISYLEPALFYEKVFILPELAPDGKRWNRRKTDHKEAWQAIEANNLDKYLITEQEHGIIKAMIYALDQNETCKKLFKEGHPEITGLFLDPDFEFQCKIRLDFINLSSIILDVKTTDDASEAAFQRQAIRYKYHWQAWFYLRGMTTITGRPHKRFINVAVEKPQDQSKKSFVACYEMHPDILKVAEKECLPLLAKYAECSQKNQWPGYDDEIKWLAPPRWLKKERT